MVTAPTHDAAAIAEIANPPAFPMGNPEQGGHDGMSLRDWFAGQALPAIIAEIYRVAAIDGPVESGVAGPVSAFSYEIADVLLSARAHISQAKGE